MMKSLRKTAKANQGGAALLEVGETTKSLRQFRSALKQLNEGCQSLKGLPSAHDTITDGSETSLFGGAAVRSLPIQLGEALTESLPELEQTPEQSSTRMLYSQAFIFDDSDSADMTIEKHSFFSAVLIYNTALALHQKAGKEDGHKAYLKALLFYSESMNLLRPIAEETESFRVIQEITKNQADIYYRLNDLGNVQRVWEELAYLTKEHKLGVFTMHPKTQVAATA